jgi:beta-phosphoglucomutase-like phosphatase (HAD superfamily)
LCSSIFIFTFIFTFISISISVKDLELPITAEDYLEFVRPRQYELFPDAKALPGVQQLVRHLHHHRVRKAVGTHTKTLLPTHFSHFSSHARAVVVVVCVCVVQRRVRTQRLSS